MTLLPNPRAIGELYSETAVPSTVALPIPLIPPMPSCPCPTVPIPMGHGNGTAGRCRFRQAPRREPESRPCPPVWSPLWDRHECSWCAFHIPLPPQPLPEGSQRFRLAARNQMGRLPLIARRDGNRVRLYTRRGYDWSGKYPWIVDMLLSLSVRSITVDGEAVRCGKDGKSDFDGQKHSCHVRSSYRQLRVAEAIEQTLGVAIGYEPRRHEWF
jgi:hypothetical protein